MATPTPGSGQEEGDEDDGERGTSPASSSSPGRRRWSFPLASQQPPLVRRRLAQDQVSSPDPVGPLSVNWSDDGPVSPVARTTGGRAFGSGATTPSPAWSPRPPELSPAIPPSRRLSTTAMPEGLRGDRLVAAHHHHPHHHSPVTDTTRAALSSSPLRREPPSWHSSPPKGSPPQLANRRTVRAPQEAEASPAVRLFSN